MDRRPSGALAAGELAAGELADKGGNRDHEEEQGHRAGSKVDAAVTD